MAAEYRSEDWDRYRMSYGDPHAELEPAEREIAVVDEALGALREAGAIPHTRYDGQKMLALRAAVRERFEVPWTAITPRMQRLLYAIGAIAQPVNLVAAGVFCGFTFISSAGAAVGPGACYTAGRLVGVEIRPDEAARAERNVRRIDPTGTACVVAADAIDVVGSFADPIDLLYLDADGRGGKGKGIYLDIVEAAWERIPPGGLVLAHNSANQAGRLADYLAFVRDRHHCRASVNVVFDPEGLEVSVR
jgi:predicted O-methyltransferase YrrM